MQLEQNNHDFENVVRDSLYDAGWAPPAKPAYSNILTGNKKMFPKNKLIIKSSGIDNCEKEVKSIRYNQQKRRLTQTYSIRG